jgi:hypothetical protein
MTTMSDTTTQLPDDDWMERTLRAQARARADDYLADDGFTARVMADLPASATLPAWRQRAVAAIWTVAAAGIAFAFPETFLDVAREAYRLAVQPVSLPQIGVGVLALAGAMWAGAAMLLKED